MKLHGIERLLAETIGLDARTVGTTALQRAVQTRMATLGLADPDTYAAKLNESKTDLADLVEDIVVPESWFFRDVQPFLRLQELARTWPSDRSLRALSIPCATGEEPYSMAIALLAAGQPAERVHIDAVDISQRSLDRARRGVFRQYSFRGAEPLDLRPYFRAGRDELEVISTVRAAVHFHQGNLVDEELLANEAPYDVIFCRNLLIYLTDAAREHALATLDRLLAADGLLVAGHAEALAVQPRFVFDGDHRSFAFRRPTPDREAVKWRSAATIEKPFSRAPKGSGPPRAPRTPRPAAHRPQERPNPPPRQPTATPPLSRASMLAQAADLADRRQHVEAARLCEEALRAHGPSATAYKLLGVIGMAMGATAQAEENLLKAVYLDCNEEEALLALALLARRRGEPETAERFQRRAERAHRAKERA